MGSSRVHAPQTNLSFTDRMQNAFLQAVTERQRGALNKLDKPTRFSSQPKIRGLLDVPKIMMFLLRKK